MDRFIKFFQAVGVTAIVLAITVGYGTLQGASAQDGPCGGNPYCHDDLRSEREYYDIPCIHTFCDSSKHFCCLDGVAGG